MPRSSGSGKLRNGDRASKKREAAARGENEVIGELFTRGDGLLAGRRELLKGSFWEA